MGKVIDLTFSVNQRKQPLKEIVLPDGTIRKVPAKDWKNEVLRNPNGATAERARKNKDPDLKEIKVPVLNRGGFTTPHRVSPEVVLDESEKIDRRRGIGMGVKDLRMSTVSPEAAKRRGYMPAEEGRPVGRGGSSGRDKEKDASEETSD